MLCCFTRQDGPPRFKQNQRIVHEVFLNDKATFKCTALARPAPKIHWYRNGEFLNYTMLSANERLRENKKHFSLEIRRVEVGDQGSWTCKVWNQAGSIFRNFTLEIIDFCDYFLMDEYPAKKVPEKCVCVWFLTDEYRKEGVDWNEINEERCESYRKYASKVRKPFGKKMCANAPCMRNLNETTVTTTSATILHGVGLHDSVPNNFMHDYSNGNRMRSSTPTADVAAKRLRTRTVLQQQFPAVGAGNSLENDDDDESTEMVSLKRKNSPIDMPMHDEPRPDPEIKDNPLSPTSLASTTLSTSTTTATTTTTASSTTRQTTRLSFPPQKVPPYFKVRDEDASTSVITPSGRTIKLQCKAGGQPEPQVIWFNSNKKVITTEVRRPVGAEFRLRKNTLEIEDVAESDSGDYTCEAFNSAGSVTRTFKLRVVDRMRSKPIIVPNILVNQTVDANSTVNFTCKVISDLTPHIVWMRIELTNDSIYYWNETDRKYVFRYTDMRTVENAFITKTSQDSSTLTIINVTVADQGMYACVSGNHLGHAIANATLTVNEFHAMTLATGNPDSEWSWTSLLVLIILAVVLAIVLGASTLYIFCVKRNSKAHIAQMEQLIGPVKKRVVITKRVVDPSETDGWSDMPSTYQIHIEPIATSPHRRPRLSSDLTLLSDYEIPPDPAWEVDRSRLRFVDLLGEGAFGEVWKAMLKPVSKANAIIQSDSSELEMPVAVKKLKASAHEKELIDLVSEMETFKIIGHHENLIRLIGCCTGTGPLYVILELCRHGNLRDFLRAHRPRDADSTSRAHDSPPFTSDAYLEPRKPSFGKDIESEPQLLIKNLTQRHLVQFAWQVAKGMEFMAARKIIHRDLAARNVLVGDDFVMKISDFGLSRDVHYNDYYRKKGNGRLPIKWMALEALDSHVYTIYSDVWSFGILLWEIMTLGGTPYPSIAMQQLYSCLKEGYRMEAPDNCPEEIYDVMVACWQEKPENRPSFDTLVDYFDWMLTQSAQEQENYLEVQSITSEADEEIKVIAPPPPLTSGVGSLVKRRKIRPLSEPIICPSETIDDSDSEMDSDNDSRPLLSGAKAVLYSQNEGPGVHYAFVRRSGIPLPVPDPIISSLCSEKKLNSTATVSVDSAIGSPLWTIGVNTSVLLDGAEACATPSDSDEQLMNERLPPTEDGLQHALASTTSNEQIRLSSEMRNFKDETFADGRRFQPHYVNIPQEDGPHRGKLLATRFPFPPSRHTRFSDSSAYEPDAVQLSMLNPATAESYTPIFNV
uniref:Receptor protein-tyrosine kinase n=1 Tax=Parascaris univalens TaxID=6257 RepID=A0A915CAJ0_PARUN